MGPPATRTEMKLKSISYRHHIIIIICGWARFLFALFTTRHLHFDESRFKWKNFCSAKCSTEIDKRPNGASCDRIKLWIELSLNALSVHRSISNKEKFAATWGICAYLDGAQHIIEWQTIKRFLVLHWIRLLCAYTAAWHDGRLRWRTLGCGTWVGRTVIHVCW